jgi:hypothetical protein
MSVVRELHSAILELPVNTMVPESGGWMRSLSSNLRIEDSQDST